MTFVNKVVVITGAASGIGAAIALSFTKLNAHVCIIDINEKNLLEIKSQCERQSKNKVLEVVADLSRDKDVEHAVERAIKEFGKIDVLVNCAGIIISGSILDSDIIETFDKVMSINLRAMVVMTKQALPALIESKGCIVNISSISSSLTSKNRLSYGVSKAGVTKFTKCAAFDLASKGVRVNCISPGTVKTNIWRNAGLTEAECHKHYELIATKNPLRKFVKVEDIAELAVYLASDKAECITGSDFVVDAGFMLGTADNLTPDIPNLQTDNKC